MPDLSLPALIVVSLFAIFLVGSFRSGTNGSFYLFRALFPSWRFFEDVTDVPVLFYRIESKSTEGKPNDGDSIPEFGPWTPGLRQLNRNFGSLLFNPQGNLVHAINSLLQHLEIDVGETSPERIDSFEETVSFCLVKDFVDYLLQGGKYLDSAERAVPGTKYQFKIGRVRQGAPVEQFEQFLISKVLRI